MGGLLLKLDHEGVTDQIAEFKDKGVANLVVNADPLLLPRDNVGLGQNFEVFGNVGLERCIPWKESSRGQTADWGNGGGVWLGMGDGCGRLRRWLVVSRTVQG